MVAVADAVAAAAADAADAADAALAGACLGVAAVRGANKARPLTF